jgi:putative nucleotidyltransferase with HDIG domain
MKPDRWFYRAKQFFEILIARPAPADLELVRRTLTAEQTALFTQLHPSEQAHAIRVLLAVQARCKQEGIETPADLKVAALLHDVGKARYPLRVWERVTIVLGNAIWPEAATRWGTGAPRGWKRPFVIAAQHPAWGAEMAAEHGVAPGAAALIRRHQDALPLPGTSVQTEANSLLAILQAVDDEN